MNKNTNDLLEQLFRLEWLLRRRHMQNHRQRGPMGSPHQGQGRILALLRLKPEISQKELATILDIRPQSLGELLSKLERQGYITRNPSTEDRRVVDIRLTEAGRLAAEQPDAGADPDSFFGCLNETEQAMFGDYLERLIKNLEEELNAKGTEADFQNRPDFGGRGYGHPFHGECGPSQEDFRGFGHFHDRGHHG